MILMMMIVMMVMDDDSDGYDESYDEHDDFVD
jgi:hypothetical protein